MTDTKQPPKDIAILSGPTEDGQGARVVRIREGRDISAGEIRPVRDGEPINQSELVRLHPLDANKRVCAVEVLHGPAGSAPAEGGDKNAEAAEGKRAAGAGPVRVSNAKYRQNWSVIFGSSDKPADGDWSLN